MLLCVSMSKCRRCSGALGGQKRVSDTECQAVVSCLMWVMENEFRSSGRAGHALNHWPSLQSLLYFLMDTILLPAVSPRCWLVFSSYLIFLSIRKVATTTDMLRPTLTIISTYWVALYDSSHFQACPGLWIPWKEPFISMKGKTDFAMATFEVSNHCWACEVFRNVWLLVPCLLLTFAYLFNKC